MSAYSIGTTGRLHIKDNKKFLELLSGTNTDSYQKLKAYGIKNLTKIATDIPFGDQEMIINWAIVKMMQSYNEDAGANLLTYFNIKLKGEISDYRAKRDSMTRKVHKIINEPIDGESIIYQYNHESEHNDIEYITEDNPDSILISADIYYRKTQAFRMAYSGIPKYSQMILNTIVMSSLTLEEIAERESLDKEEITKIRNFALSLILSRVLRSNHLTEEEKEEIKSELGFD